MADPKPSAIPSPQPNLNSLYEVSIALKQNVEALTGQRGGPLQRSPTWQDLINLGIVTADQVPT